MVGVIGELAPEEEVADSASRTERGHVEAVGLEPETNKVGELLTNALTDPMVEEVTLVE